MITKTDKILNSWQWFFHLENYWEFLPNIDCDNYPKGEYHIVCPECGAENIIYEDTLLERKNPRCYNCDYFTSLIYHPNFNRAFKTKIKERDNYTCQDCGSMENLCIHHINYDKNNDCSNPKDFLTTCNSCNLSLNYNRPLQTKRCKQIIKEIYS